MLFPTLRPSSLLVVVAQPDEKHANRAASVLECMTDTEHSKTSSSNEEDPYPWHKYPFAFCMYYQCYFIV